MKINDKVKIVRKDTIEHWKVMDYPLTGRIVTIDSNHMEGLSHRPICVRFDDGRESWWASQELKKIRQ